MRSLGLLLLRLSVGGTLMAHGYPKLFGGPEKKPPEQLVKALGENWRAFNERAGPKNFAAGLESMGVPYPTLGAYASGITELFGGAALILGFKTRLAALAIIFNLGVAIWKAHWKTGFFGEGGFELPASLAAGAATLTLTGPGALSIDGACSHMCGCCSKDEEEED
jgi:putative oxidoreductase